MFVLPEPYNDVCVIQPQQFLQELYGGPTRLVRIAPKHIRRIKQQKNEPQKSTEYALELKLDVNQFEPEEITVKLEGNKLVIIAKHEEQKGEFDSFANYMVRKTRIPEDADLDGIISKFSKDGILTVTVPKKVVKIDGERIIPIIRTNEVLRIEEETKTVQVEKQEVKEGKVEDHEEKELVNDSIEDKEESQDASST